MAVEVQFIIAWGMILIMLAVLAMALIVIGQLARRRLMRSYGFILGGLMAFAVPMARYISEAGDDWTAFTPTAADILVLGCLSFLGGMMTIFGLMDMKEAQRLKSRVQGSQSKDRASAPDQ